MTIIVTAAPAICDRVTVARFAGGGAPHLAATAGPHAYAFRGLSAEQSSRSPTSRIAAFDAAVRGLLAAGGGLHGWSYVGRVAFAGSPKAGRLVHSSG